MNHFTDCIREAKLAWILQGKSYFLKSCIIWLRVLFNTSVHFHKIIKPSCCHVEDIFIPFRTEILLCKMNLISENTDLDSSEASICFKVRIGSISCQEKHLPLLVPSISLSV